MNCPDGMIERVGYKTIRRENKKMYKVNPTCIRDVGKPGKTPSNERIVSSDETDLSIYGYENLMKIKVSDRQSALKKAILELSSMEGTEHAAAVKVMRRLNYLAVLTVNTQPALSKKLKADRDWIGKTYLGKNYKA